MRSVSLLLLGAVLVACGGATAPDDGRTVKASPSLAADIQEIFTRRGCTELNCHGDARTEGLDLRAGAAWQHLVQVPATQDSSRFRVQPGDPHNSYLMIKLEGRQTEGVRMPFGREPLDSIDLTNIRNWIVNGAPNN